MLSSCHLEKIVTEWCSSGGVSMLDGGMDDVEGSKAYHAQVRISLSNFGRFKDPSGFFDHGFHAFERGLESSKAFRCQLEELGRLSSKESNELEKLEKQIRIIHPLVDAVVFLGKLNF